MIDGALILGALCRCELLGTTHRSRLRLIGTPLSLLKLHPKLNAMVLLD